MGAVIAGVLMYFFMEKKATQFAADLETEYHKHYAILIDSVRQSGLVNVMGSLLEKAEQEIDQRQDHTLSDATIMQLTALSDGFRPYAILKGDQLSTNEYSPERGHLLLMLLGMKMDSSSWQKILSSVTFENADLHGADLHDAQLIGINLSAANLKDANLEGARLDGANLRFASLWGAQLQNAGLSGSDATRANFSWANLNQAKLDSTILSGADLTSADFSRASLINTTVHWANLMGTYFDRADLSGADLLGSLIEKTRFVGTNLSHANFIKTVLAEMDMTEAIVQGLIVQDECWLSRQSESTVKGVSELQEKYTVRKDSSEKEVKYIIAAL